MTGSAYNVRKAAQMVAFFVLKEGGRLDVLKLAKLLYLSNRSHLKHFDMPMLFDTSVSMRHGPVLSITKDYVDGDLRDEGDWDAFVGARQDNQLIAKEGVDENSFDHLSKADLIVLEEVWGEFGHYHTWQLRDLTHVMCEEWEDPGLSSTVIPIERILKNLDKGNYKDIADHISSVTGVMQT